jgi:lipoprotein-anchoring transpeptidase ErfK/SrfK
MIGKQSFNRRDFLKLSASALGGMFLSSLGLPSIQAAESTPKLGRVVYNKINIHATPDFEGKKEGTRKFDELLKVSAVVFSADLSADDRTGNASCSLASPSVDPTAYNRTWYRLEEGGYVYSGGIQPVQEIFNSLVTDIPKEGGRLAELTVPFTDSRWKPTLNSRRGYRLYYGTTYWVRAIFEDEKGNPWYRIYDDLMKLVFFIRAEHLRIVPPEELTPISPEVPAAEKSILVSLAEQQMVAYEGREAVFSAQVSTGVGKGNRHYASTPIGEFTTFFKRPAGHMVGGAGGSAYDLPGVPWTSYINTSGVSFHGTYWHNDFGKPHSHGCINLPSEKAKWLYRWTSPSVPAGERQVYQPGTGTRVTIVDFPVFAPTLFPKDKVRSC